jgi:GTPase SAR1 family protein
MDEVGYPHQIVNLDPGADLSPYEADVDVRDWMTLADIMEEYGLGPNGAQIIAADMLAIYSTRIREMLDLNEGRYIIFDTPGQMELFSFREATRELVKSLVPNSYLVYLVDPFNARTPTGFVTQLMLSALSRLRFQVPSIEVLSKADLMEDKMKEDIRRWQELPDQLMEDVISEAGQEPGMARELSVGINKALEDLGIASKLFPVSSATGEGIERIYEVIQLTYGAGDDLIPADEDR